MGALPRLLPWDSASHLDRSGADGSRGGSSWVDSFGADSWVGGSWVGDSWAGHSSVGDSWAVESSPVERSRVESSPVAWCRVVLWEAAVPACPVGRSAAEG